MYIFSKGLEYESVFYGRFFIGKKEFFFRIREMSFF